MEHKYTVEELIRKHGRPQTRKDGQELMFPCPKCGRSKFEININKNVFHCFRCGTSGKIWVTGRNYYTEFRDKVEKTVDRFDPPLSKMLGDEHLNFLQGRGMNKTRAFHIGMKAGCDKLRNRIIIPIMENGITVAAVARSIDNRTPKELFLGESKGNVLYNLDAVGGDWRRIIITEGIFDAEAVIRAGYVPVSVLGSSITDVQVGKLLSKRPYEILIMTDNDQAGREGALKVFKKIRQRFNGFVGVVRWRSSPMFSGYKDPGECPTYVIKEMVHKFAFSIWQCQAAE